MKYTGQLPQSQQDIIVESLRIYKEFLDNNVLTTQTEEDLLHLKFDVRTLIAMFKDMEVEINYKLDKKVFDSFVFRNGVDFPIYI
tara:strand:+ start:18 stop:272 length:255 start_codon:yes stop_codon:yes gene_type:complete